jgi:hypothetical protein
MPIAPSLFRGGGVTYAVRLALCLLSIDIQFGPVALKMSAFRFLHLRRTLTNCSSLSGHRSV